MAPGDSRVLKPHNRSPLLPADTKASNLRKSLSSALRPKTCLSSGDSPGQGGLAFELTRLQNEIRHKDREAAAKDEELRTLRTAVGVKDKALEAAQAANQLLTSRSLKAEADLRTCSQQLQSTKSELSKALSEAAAASRHADKLTHKMANMPQGPAFSERLAAVEGELTLNRKESQRLADDNRGMVAQLRAKDKELDVMGERVREAEAVLIKNKELENQILHLERQVRTGNEERATLMEVQRQCCADFDDLTSRLQTANDELAATHATLGVTQTSLKASEEQRSLLAGELALLREQLVRVGAVAERAAVREVTAGPKDSGTVPVHQHLEEVRYCQAEIERLREKVAAAERSSAAARQQKEALHKKLDQALASGTTRTRSGSPIAPGTPMSASKTPQAAQPVAGELAHLKEENAALREQVERHGPRMAALRQQIYRLERQLGGGSAPSTPPNVRARADKRASEKGEVMVDVATETTPRTLSDAALVPLTPEDPE